MDLDTKGTHFKHGLTRFHLEYIIKIMESILDLPLIQCASCVTNSGPPWRKTVYPPLNKNFAFIILEFSVHSLADLGQMVVD